MSEKAKKKIKTIKVDVDKCNGCRACEVACSAFHAAPQYSSNNPARSRVRVIREPFRDIYVPVYAGENAKAECLGRDKYIIDGKEYEECAFCRASCPRYVETVLPPKRARIKTAVRLASPGFRRHQSHTFWGRLTGRALMG